MTDLNPRYGDTCDDCLNVAFPVMAIADGPDGMTAAYRCACGSAWTTGWAIVPGRTIPPKPTGREPQPLRELAAQLCEEAAIGRAWRHLHRGPGAAA